FLDVVFRLFQLVFHEFQRRGLVEVLDREHRLEHALDAFAVLVALTLTRGKEQVIRGFLNLDEVRHFKNFADIAVIAPDALLADVGLRHGGNRLSSSRGGSSGPDPRHAYEHQGCGSIRAARPTAQLPNRKLALKETRPR